MEMFPTKESAIKFFEKTMWKKQVTCIKCGCDSKIKPQKDKFNYWCGDCRSYFNVFTNTPLERSKLDPRKWLYAGYLMLTSRKGVSSMQLSHELKIKQPTAWYLMHRLRVACTSRNSALLNGIVEVDEAYVGGKERMKHKGKRTITAHGKTAKVQGKTGVFGIKRRNGETRAVVMDKITKDKIANYLESNVEFGTSVFSDSSILYRKIKGYDWDMINHREGEYVRDEVHTNSIESVWAILKRSHKGTFHKLSKKHLQKYMDETVFRLDEGNCEIDTIDRMESLFGNMLGKKTTYRGMVE